MRGSRRRERSSSVKSPRRDRVTASRTALTQAAIDVASAIPTCPSQYDRRKLAQMFTITETIAKRMGVVVSSRA